MSRTIAGTSTTGVTLSNTSDNPVLVSGTIATSNADALYGIGGSSYSWTITNTGLISETGTVAGGIQLGKQSTGVSAGLVTNATGGIITGSAFGVTIFGPGTIINDAHATIAGNAEGVGIYGMAGSAYINNAGTISNAATGTGAAAYMALGGTLTNSGVITGSMGVVLGAIATPPFTPMTVVNSGTIIGAGGTALKVQQSSFNGNRLIDDTSGVFVGAVKGGGLGWTLELASGAGTGTLSNIVQFPSIQFDSGASWLLQSSYSSIGSKYGNPSAIAGFTAGDTIDLQGLAATSLTGVAGTVAGTGDLTLTTAGTQNTTLAFANNFTLANFHIAPDLSGGTDLTFGPPATGLTITGSSTIGVTLTSESQNPVLVNGTIVAADNAIYGDGGLFWTIVNAGYLKGTDASTINLYDGIRLGSSTSSVVYGSIANHGGKLISGGNRGIAIYGKGVINNSGGTIAGHQGIAIYDAATSSSTIRNSGLITGTYAISGQPAGDGVLLNFGTVQNFQYAAIIGTNDGVYVKSNSTVISAGTITGGIAAVYLDSGDRLVALPGAVFNGAVAGAASAGSVNVLELDAGSYFGTLANVTNIGSIQFDAGSQWLLRSTYTSLVASTIAGGGVISGFTSGDTIDLQGFSAATGDSVVNGALVLTNSAGQHATLSLLNGIAQLPSFTIASDGSGGTDLTVGPIPTGTIFGIATYGITLTREAENPVLVTGTIAATSGDALAVDGFSSFTWTVTNAGLISTTGHEDTAVYIGPDGTITNGLITNMAGKTIAGAGYGVHVTGGANILNGVNALITGGDAGIVLNNQHSGYTIINDGVISGGAANDIPFVHAGVAADSGFLINYGTITGQTGVNLGHYGGIVINDGTISATGTTAGSYAVIADGLYVVPGAVFNGNILGGHGTLGLEASTLAGTSTLTSFSGFGFINFNSGAHWLLRDGFNEFGAPLGTHAYPPLISGLAGSTIDMDNFAATGTPKLYAHGDLQIPGTFLPGSTSAYTGLMQLTVLGGYSLDQFLITPDGSGGTNLSIVCFAEGTSISTERGDVPVEQLCAGDMVRTEISGAVLPVVWIGKRHVDCGRHPEPHQAWPVRIRAGAFGAGLPQRDLLVSPNHAVYVDGVLIPARLLINGTSIAQVPVEQITYYHVELPRHEVLRAEGLAVESYLDAGDRASFANGGGLARLHPDFATRRWEVRGCAPLVVTGPALEAVRRRLDARAAVLQLAA
jgi:Hint domain